MGEKSLFYSSIRSPNYIIPQVQTEIIRNNRTTFPREDSLWLLRGTRTAPVRSRRRAAEARGQGHVRGVREGEVEDDCAEFSRSRQQAMSQPMEASPRSDDCQGAVDRR